MEWKYDIIGCNVVVVHTDGRKMVCTVEYDFDKHGFNYRSNLLVTKHFTYKGRCYDRTKPGNNDLYRKLLRDIGTTTFNRIALEIVR